MADGPVSILIDPHDIVSVSSAGNYAEYVLTGSRKHLIRTTVQTEQARLAAFGVARVHRSKRINVKRIVALWRPAGEFEIRLDGGEIVTGSRRFKRVVSEIAERAKAYAGFRPDPPDKPCPTADRDAFCFRLFP